MRPSSVLLPLVVGALALTASAQNVAVVPPVCADLPGNAALAMPLRWSDATLQVRIDAGLLPTSQGQTITAIRLRRPTFLQEPGYPALSRTLSVMAGFETGFRGLPDAMTRNRDFNRPPMANRVSVFGPTVISVPATAAPGPGTQVGDDFLVIPFSAPLPVQPGTLFLEFVTSDGPFQIEPEQWVDAVWVDDGVPKGYAVTLGDGSCTTRSVPSELRWTDPSTGPMPGGQAALQATGAAPGAFYLVVFGLEPVARAASPTYMGFGQSLTAFDPTLTGCFQWTPADVTLGGLSDPGGSYSTSFTLLGGASAVGMQIGAQAVWLDTSRQGAPVSLSNGLMLVLDNVDVRDRCATAYFPSSVNYSPWEPYLGQMPVITIEYN
ncbi:MAG: hypothetical protein NXI31_08070 [bacterium]|nr:hypothetical protein [bacterium]